MRKWMFVLLTLLLSLGAFARDSITITNSYFFSLTDALKASTFRLTEPLL